MLDETIEGVLKRLSEEFVVDNNTMLGKFTYEDLLTDIYSSALRRNVIGDLQIFEAEKTEFGTEATFQFSPIYLNRRPDMLYAGIGKIKWKLILPDSELKEDVTEYNESEVSEEIISKLSESRVEVIYFEPKDNFSLGDFVESLVSEKE